MTFDLTRYHFLSWMEGMWQYGWKAGLCQVKITVLEMTLLACRQGNAAKVNQNLLHEYLCSITFWTWNDVTVIVKLLFRGRVAMWSKGFYSRIPHLRNHFFKNLKQSLIQWDLSCVSGASFIYIVQFHIYCTTVCRKVKFIYNIPRTLAFR